MDLWIRSQDRERLSNCCDFRIYYDDDARMWAIDSCDIVGYYTSYERALQVLDEIQNKIQNQYLLKPKGNIKPDMIQDAKRYFENLNGIKIVACDDFFEMLPINSNVVVYELPKE